MDEPATETTGRAPRGRRVLVTGATGLLGSHVTERLTVEGNDVRALVRLGSRTDFLDALGVEIVRGDLTDATACASAVAGVEPLIFPLRRESRRLPGKVERA